MRAFVIILLVLNFAMSVFGNNFRRSNLKNQLPIPFNSAQRAGGSAENMIMILNERLDRVRKFTVDSMIVPATYYNINSGNNFLTVSAESFSGPIVVSIHIYPGLYTAQELLDELRGRISQYELKLYPRLEDNKVVYYVNSGNLATIFPLSDINPTITPEEQFTYDRISTVVKTLGFSGELMMVANTSSADTKLTDTNRIEDRNDLIPLFTEPTMLVTSFISPGSTDVHTIASLLETSMNTNVDINVGVGYNMISKKFSIISEYPIVIPFTLDNANLGFTSSIGPGLSFDANISIPVDEPTITSNNLLFTIRDERNANIILPDLSSDTLEDVAIILENLLNNSALVNNYTVTIERQNNVFLIDSSGDFKITSSSVNFANVFGFPLNSNRTYLYGDVNYPYFTTIGPMDFTIVVLKSYAFVESGNYDLESFRLAAENALNAVQVPNTWTITHNAIKNKFSVDTGGPDVIIANIIESAYFQLGLDISTIDIDQFTSPFVLPNIININPNKYIDIKSSTMLADKELLIYSDISNLLTIGRLYIDENNRFGTTIRYFRDTFQTFFPLNVSYQEIDFRLEWENNRLIELNGESWAFVILFGVF